MTDGVLKNESSSLTFERDWYPSPTLITLNCQFSSKALKIHKAPQKFPIAHPLYLTGPMITHHTRSMSKFPRAIWGIVYIPLVRMSITWMTKAVQEELSVALANKVQMVSHGSKIPGVNATGERISVGCFKLGDTQAKVRQRKIPVKRGFISTINQSPITTNIPAAQYMMRIRKYREGKNWTTRKALFCGNSDTTITVLALTNEADGEDWNYFIK